MPTPGVAPPTVIKGYSEVNCIAFNETYSREGSLCTPFCDGSAQCQILRWGHPSFPDPLKVVMPNEGNLKETSPTWRKVYSEVSGIVFNVSYSQEGSTPLFVTSYIEIVTPI